MDELIPYDFQVAPKKIRKRQRCAQGRIWIDNSDFEIVKTDVVLRTTAFSVREKGFASG